MVKAVASTMNVSQIPTISFDRTPRLATAYVGTTTAARAATGATNLNPRVSTSTPSSGTLRKDFHLVPIYALAMQFRLARA